ncbi:uncharacterized protein LOC135484492 [Lineus longissimus]|uniref:uncharacterized protein LOC135484492 n=1 Tax=Lineus longissimus TaxID=88925 RepID=UPI002B4EEF8E
MPKMRLIYAVLVICAALNLSGAFLLRENVQQPASSDLDDNCTVIASRGDCDFYTCFQRRHQCSEYLVEHARDLCTKLENRRPQFTAQGQVWLSNQTKCVMEKLVPSYRLSVLDCNDLTEAGYGFYLECSLSGRPNVCDIIWQNIEHFMAVTNMRSVRDAKFAFTTMTKCGLQSLQRFIRYLQEIRTPFTALDIH